jgi:preprotein translocase subunit SecE
MSDKAAKTEKKAKSSFFKGLKGEFKKIIWTDKKTLVKQTIAVLLISAILCVIITLVDSGALALVDLMIK